jgi:hypothetical protein
MNHVTQSYYGMRHIGVGYVPIGLGDAPGDLSTFNRFLSNGDQAIGAGMFDAAVVAYQGAGNFGAVTVGPEIDAQTGGSSKPLTGQAWDINTNLAAVTNNGASAQDAQMAQGFARQMQNLYQTAIQLPPASSGGGSTQPSSNLVSAAQNLASFLQQNGCTTSSFQACTDFQTAYNAEGQVQLAVDGKYGRGTEGALQRVLTVSGAGGSAPASCFVTPPTKPGNTPAPSPAPPGGIASASMMPWGTIAIAAAAVTGAAAIAYAVHKKKGGRSMGHHVRHAARHGLRRLRRTRNPLALEARKKSGKRRRRAGGGDRGGRLEKFSPKYQGAHILTFRDRAKVLGASHDEWGFVSSYHNPWTPIGEGHGYRTRSEAIAAAKSSVRQRG